MEVKFAEEKDIPDIDRLLFQVEKIHHDGRPDLFRNGAKKYTDDELKKILSDKKTPVLGAYDDGKLKGYAFCIIKENNGDNVLADMKTLYIDDLCVDENCRGEHIGQLLFESAKKFAKEIGCYNVTLNVWECNPTARRFYERMGMMPYKTAMEYILEN